MQEAALQAGARSGLEAEKACFSEMDPQVPNTPSFMPLTPRETAAPSREELWSVFPLACAKKTAALTSLIGHSWKAGLCFHSGCPTVTSHCQTCRGQTPRSQLKPVPSGLSSPPSSS